MIINYHNKLLFVDYLRDTLSMSRIFVVVNSLVNIRTITVIIFNV